jgi:RNA polymerase sigma-70 factor (ECF subfamily)
LSGSDAAITLGNLAVKAAVRDRSAEVTALVGREATGLLRYFLRRTSSPDDAADLLGETLLIVWRRERSIPDDDTRARMWMFGVARKVLVGQRRTATRKSALTARLVMELSIHSPASADDVSVEVRSAIAKLGAIDQEIVRLVYWDGFTLAEVAQILHIRPATVRSRHARARAKLREDLGADI